jgi:hypothetical protein
MDCSPQLMVDHVHRSLPAARSMAHREHLLLTPTTPLSCGSAPHSGALAADELVCTGVSVALRLVGAWEGLWPGDSSNSGLPWGSEWVERPRRHGVLGHGDYGRWRRSTAFGAPFLPNSESMARSEGWRS